MLHNYHLAGNNKYLCNLNSCEENDDILVSLDTRNSTKCRIISLDTVPATPPLLGLVHLNVRSLVAHHEELEVTLNAMGFPSIISICETWLNPTNESLYSIPEYNIYPISRDNRKGGGISILAKNELICSVRNDFCQYLNSAIEAVFAEV